MTKYIVETTYNFQEFDEYRDAEIYCGENNIPCDCIYEEEYTEYADKMDDIIHKFGFEAQETICFCKFCETVASWEDKNYADLCVATMHMAFMDDNYVSVAENEEN